MLPPGGPKWLDRERGESAGPAERHPRQARGRRQAPGRTRQLIFALPPLPLAAPHMSCGSRPRPGSNHSPTQTRLPRLLGQTPSFQFPGRMAGGVKPEADRIRSVSELQLKLDLAPQDREIAKTARKSASWPSPGAQRDLSRESPLSDSLLRFPSEALLLHADP